MMAQKALGRPLAILLVILVIPPAFAQKTLNTFVWQGFINRGQALEIKGINATSVHAQQRETRFG